MMGTNSYKIYLNYKNLLEGLQTGEKTIKELHEITQVDLSTIYRMIGLLLDENIIIVSGYKGFTGRGIRRVRKFKIKPILKYRK